MKTKLIELIDFKKVDTLLDGFNKTTGFVTAILDLNGNVLSKSGWRQICTYFHPDNPETSKKCTISDTELAGKLTEGEKYHFYKCLSGLVDVAVPIVINGEHIANVFSGKFFFEEPNRSFFEQQAEEYGFDVKKYLKALDEVPIVSKEKVQITIDFLLNIIQLISETTLQKLEQTEANNALKESEERFQLLFNNAPLGYQSLDINGCFIEVNQQWLDMLGYTRDEVIGKWFGDFMTAESQILVKEKFPLFKAQGHIHSEFEMIHKNGSQLFIAFDGKIGYDLKGDFKQTHCILQDITQRRLAEEALIESETHFRTLANFGQALIWTSGTDKKCNYFNQPWLDFTGRTLEQEIGDGWVEGVHPDDLERCIEIYVSSFDRHEKFSMDYRLRHASGEYRWIQDDGTPRYNSKNEFIGYIGHCLDISGRKQAEEEIKQSQALSKTVIDSIPGTFYMINDRGKYIGWNAYQRDKIVGKQENQMLEMNAIDTIHPDDRQIVSEKIANVLKNGIEEVVEARVLLQGGPDFKWLLMTGTQMMVNGSPVLVGIGIDISERKKAQQTLLESEKRLKAITNYSASWEAWFNKDGRLVWTNSYCEKITGYTAEEYLAADNFLELAVSESDLSKVQNTLFNALTPTSGENLEIRCKRKERDEVWVSFSWVPIYDSDGNNIGIRTSASDLTQRRLAEEALNTANYELEKTELIAKIGGWSIDVKTMTPYLSRGVREIYEIDTELVLSVEEGIKFYIPEHRPVIEKAVQECMQSGTPYELELQIITAKGNKRWVRTGGSAEIENDSIVKITGFIQDITELKKADEQRRVSDERFLTAWNMSPDGFTILKPMRDAQNQIIDFIWVYQNAAVAKMNGTYPQDIVGKNLLELFPGHNATKFWNAYVQVAETSELITFEDAYEGESITKKTWFRIVVVPMDKNIAILAQNITASKLAEEALYATNYELEKTEVVAKIGGWSIDVKTMTPYLSRGVREIYEIDTELVLSVEEGIKFYIPEHRPVIEKAVQECMQSGTPYELELQIITAKGNKRWVRTGGSAEIENDSIVKITGFIQDITKQKNAELELQSAYQQLQANEQQLMASNQQLAASEQQLRATNQQLATTEQQLRATVQQLTASEKKLMDAKEKAEINEKYYHTIINKMGDPVFVKDEESRLLLVNDAFCEMFGLESSLIIGKTLA